MSVQAHLFDAQAHDAQVRFEDHPPSTLTNRQLLWIHLQAPGQEELRRTGAFLGLSPSSLDALEYSPRRPALLHSGAYTHLHVLTAVEREGRYRTSPLHLIAGENYVLSLARHPVSFLQDFEANLQADTALGELDSAAFLAALLGRHVESYLLALDPLEEAIDGLDARTLTEPVGPELLADLARLRGQVGDLCRLLTAHRRVYSALARPDFVAFVGDEPERHLRALAAEYEHTVDSLESARSLVLGSFDLYTARATLRTNDVVSVLTLATVALGLLATLAGFLGTNFEAGVFELGDRGFYGTLALGLLLVGGLVLVARRRRWW